MTFLSIVIAFLVERVFQEYRPRREHRWFRHYCKSVGSIGLLNWVSSRPWGPFLLVVPPVVAVSWLEGILYAIGGLFGLLFSAFVLLLSLGPRDLGDDASTHYSVDLCFAYMCDVIRLARRVSSTDPLIDALVALIESF